MKRLLPAALLIALLIASSASAECFSTKPYLRFSESEYQCCCSYPPDYYSFDVEVEYCGPKICQLLAHIEFDGTFTIQPLKWDDVQIVPGDAWNDRHDVYIEWTEPHIGSMNGYWIVDIFLSDPTFNGTTNNGGALFRIEGLHHETPDCYCGGSIWVWMNERWDCPGLKKFPDDMFWDEANVACVGCE
jgi:hypothetical protein